MSLTGNSDDPGDIARDVAAVGRIGAVPALLKLICQNTGMGFAAVARVTDGSWTACAVQDDIQFGLLPGGQLDLQTTLCREARSARRAVVIDHASLDPVYRTHHTPRIYQIESYISVPIVLPGGAYFGNLCAIDPRPKIVSDPRTVTMFQVFADLIALQLQSEDDQLAIEGALAVERATAELREQFIAVLGHDLRNPLAAVSATAEIMVRSPEPKMTALGARLRSSAQRMSRLIDDVLDFARGRLGSGIGIDAVDVPDLGSDLREVIAESRAANPDRQLVEQIAIDRPLRCDRGRLQQLLSNLLGNAMTYGAPDQPVRVSAVLQDEALLVLEVANQGEPIPPASLGRIFEPYWRPPNSPPGGGLGLGLYICDQIARAHGGELRVRSSAGQGTVFTAILPIVARG